MLKRTLMNHIKDNKIIYVKVSIFFLIGVCFGVFCINSLDDNYIDNTKKYFYNFTESVGNLKQADIKILFINSFLEKFKFVGIIFILSCTIIGGEFIYLLNLYKGFSLGYVISAILRTYGVKKGMVFSISTLAFQNFIYIPCVIFFSVYCIKFCKNIKNNNVNIKSNLLKLFIIFLIILIISTICSTIELTISYKILKKLQNFY